MSALYSVWDIVCSVPCCVVYAGLTDVQCDDLILRKVNTSDASVFAKKYGGSSQCWGVIWSFIALAFMAVAIVAGIAAFRDSFQEQQSDSKEFIPT
jgi:hypothetical protein